MNRFLGLFNHSFNCIVMQCLMDLDDVNGNWNVFGSGHNLPQGAVIIIVRTGQFQMQ
jgi:hypothetical protein